MSYIFLPAFLSLIICRALLICTQFSKSIEISRVVISCWLIKERWSWVSTNHQTILIYQKQCVGACWRFCISLPACDIVSFCLYFNPYCWPLHLPSLSPPPPPPPGFLISLSQFVVSHCKVSILVLHLLVTVHWFRTLVSIYQVILELQRSLQGPCQNVTRYFIV